MFVMFVWLPVEFGWIDSCFNNYDLGIYGQAISLLSLNNLNPWLSTRDIHLFNDHFDPILFFATFLTQWWHPALVMIRVEMIALLIASAAPLWLAKKSLISNPIAIFAALLIGFGPMTLDAAFYPAHPGTWSLAPLSWMLAFIFAGHWRSAISAMIVTLLCKEEYPAATMMMGTVLMIIGPRTKGWWIALISALWLLGVFVARPLLMGSSQMYTDAVSSGNGLNLLLSIETIAPVLTRIFYVFAPVLLILFLSTGNRHIDRKFDRKFVMIVLSLAFVMIAVRLLGGYWGNHRSAPLSVMSAFLVIGVGGLWTPSKRALVALSILGALLVLPGLEPGSRYLRGRDFKKHCPGIPERLAAISQAESIMRNTSDGPIMAGGNLVPRLADLPGISQIGATKNNDFRYFLTEKHPMRNTWPLSKGDYQAIEDYWRTKPSAQVLMDDDWILLIRK